MKRKLTQEPAHAIPDREEVKSRPEQTKDQDHKHPEQAPVIVWAFNRCEKMPPSRPPNDRRAQRDERNRYRPIRPTDRTHDVRNVAKESSEWVVIDFGIRVHIVDVDRELHAPQEAYQSRPKCNAQEQHRQNW